MTELVEDVKALEAIQPPPDRQAALFAALARAQGRFETVQKDKTAQITSSREYSYLSLSKLLEVLRPALAAEELAVTQTFRGDNLVTSLLHSKGGVIESVMPCPRGERRPQEYGSEITYCRRYSLTALLGVAADDDDDGKAAQEADPVPEPKRRSKTSLITDAQRARLFAIAKEAAVGEEQLRDIVKGHTGDPSTSTIQVGQYELIVAEVQAMQVPF